MRSPMRAASRVLALNSPKLDSSQSCPNNDFPSLPSPMFAEPTTPSSPTILLSPSTPEFAPVSLPQESETEHEEEIFIGEGVQDRVSGSGEGANGMTASDKSGVGQEGRVDKKLRQSLMLLDTRLAELESMGFDKPAQSLNRSPTIVEAITSEEDTQGQVSDFDAVNFMLARDSSFEESKQRDISTKSLASVASGYSTHSSSEDAFDIVDFPSIDQLTLTSSYDLEQSEKPRTTEPPRDRSSDLMAFPIPPTDIPLIPFSTAPSSNPLGNKYDDVRDEDQVFERLASFGQGESMQGLGLSSSTSTSRPSSRFALSETDADSRSLCSNGSSSFEASTLASSYAPTPRFGQSTTSVNGSESKTLNTAISSSIYTRRAATAQSTMPSPSRIVPSRAFSVPATLGSPLSLAQDFPPSPSSLSPYSFSDSPVFNPSSTNRSYIRNSSFPPLDSNEYRGSAPPSPSLSQSPSRQDVGFAELHQASLGLLGDFDGGGIPMWSIQPEDKYASNGANLDDEKEELLEEEDKVSSRKIESSGHQTSKPLRSFSSSSSLNPPSPSLSFPISTLRRLSSFQILKKRKSENVLAPATDAAIGSKRPVLSKPKSEMTLSTLAKQQAQGPDTIVDLATDIGSPTLLPPGRFGKLSLRSKSSPRVPQHASPSSPWSKASGMSASPSQSTGFSARPRALSFGFDKNEGGVKSPAANSTKKRFSILVPKQFGGGRQSHVPPVPPTPTEHLPQSAAISGTTSLDSVLVVDTQKANDYALNSLQTSTSSSEIGGSATLSPVLASNCVDSPTPLSESLPSTPASEASAGQLTPNGLQDDAAFPLPSPPVSPIDDAITLATFLNYPPSSPAHPSTPLAAAASLTPKQATKANESSQPPFSDRTNWSRPTSPALLDARKTTSPFGLDELVVVPQQITVFPVRLPPVTARALAEADAEQDDEDCQDDYGGTSESEEDKPLGVVVPGALTAQKSLRKTMSRKKNPKVRPKEDPFEFEQAAAMAQTPSTSIKPPRIPVTTSSTAPFAEQSTQFGGSLASVIKTSQGHDSFLPQTDASIERKASSNGLRRSPSTPLNHMIANSALTLDSPVLTQEPLPIQQTILPSATVFPSRSMSSNSYDRAVSSTAPLRSPPLNAPPRSRPPPIPSSSLDVTSEVLSAPSLNRRPSLHPDVALAQAPHGMQRQASGSSSQSSSTSLTSPLPSPSLSQPSRPPVGGRSRSGTLANNAGMAIEHRIYLGKVTAKHLIVKITDRTVAGEVVLYAKGRGALEGGNENEGGWALWEVWTSMGLERPLREYELVNDVLKSFDGEAALVLRRTTLWPILSTHARVQPTSSKIGQVQIEMKKGKWSKRFLVLKDGTLTYSKTEKGKDTAVLCQLSNFAVFFVDEAKSRQLKAPKPAVFALKSRLTRAHFEEVSQYCNFVSVKSVDDSFGWISCITEAGNQQLRQREQAVLGTSIVPNLPTSPLLATAPALASPPLSVPATTSDAPVLSRMSSPRTFLSRTTSARPAPSVLAPSTSNPVDSHTLARHTTDNTPVARRPSAPSENDRTGPSKDSDRKVKGSQAPLVDLSQ